MSKLSPQERNALRDMFDSCADLDSIEELLLSAIHIPIDVITEPKPKPLIILRCINYLEVRDKLCCDVAAELCERFPQHPRKDEVAQLVKRFGRQSAVTPYDITLIDVKVMVNRSRLRSVLREIVVHGRPRPVVGIAGAPKSGRTQSWHIIRHVADAYGIPRAWLDLEAWPDQDRTLEHLVDRLVEAGALTGFKPPNCVGVTPETKGQRYARAVADQLGRRLGAGRLWLVFDSVDRPIDHAIIPFLRALCEAACDSIFQNCTIFVLGWGPDFSMTKPAMVEVEQLSYFLPPELTDAAKAINSLGDPPLDEATLSDRVAALHAVARTSNWPQAARDVEQLLISLGREVRAL